MKWIKKSIAKEYTMHQIWSGVYKVYAVYYLFGFIIIYVHEYKPQFRSNKTAQVYINGLKEQDAKDNA